MTDKATIKANKKLADAVFERIDSAVGETVSYNDGVIPFRRWFIGADEVIETIVGGIEKTGPSKQVLEQFDELVRVLGEAVGNYNSDATRREKMEGRRATLLENVDFTAIDNARKLVENTLAERVEAERIANKDFADHVQILLEQVTYGLKKIDDFSADDISIITTKNEKIYTSLLEHGANNDARQLLVDIVKYINSRDIELPYNNMKALEKAAELVEHALEEQKAPNNKPKTSFFKPALSPRSLLGAAAIVAAAVSGTCHEIHEDKARVTPPAPEVQPDIDLKKPEADVKGEGVMEKVTLKERDVPARK